jgi:hypothetical protein
MSYDIKEIPGESIVLVTLSESFDPAYDAVDSIEKITSILDAQPAPVFYAIDIRSLHVNFGDMVSMMGLATKGATGFLKHPNIREVVIISSSDMLTLGAKALIRAETIWRPTRVGIWKS